MQTKIAAAAKTSMLIRGPVHDVYDAFVDPSVTTRFWFTRSTGRLDEHDWVRFAGELDELAEQAINATEGFAYTLAGAKARLEHGIDLNLVPDKMPDRARS